MTRIIEDTAELDAALEDDGLVLLLLSGGAETDSEQIYDYISSEMELEDWVRVFLLENLELVGEERAEEWFDSEEDRFCCISNDSGGMTRGSVDQFFVDGEPDADEIGEVLDTVPGEDEEEEAWEEESDWKEERRWQDGEQDEEEKDEEDDEEEDEEEEEEEDDEL